jgi:hypothetical protein
VPEHLHPTVGKPIPTPRPGSTHSFDRIPRGTVELVGHLDITRVVGVLAIGGVGHGIEAGEVVDEDHGAVARALAGRVLSDRSVERDDAVHARLGPARRVQWEQVGEHEAHFGVALAHLVDQDVVGGEHFGGRLLAQEDVVGAEEHEDDVGLVDGIEPGGEVALCCVVGCQGAWVPFVVLIYVAATARAFLCPDEVEVGDSVVAELGLKVCAPTSLMGC